MFQISQLNRTFSYSTNKSLLLLLFINSCLHDEFWIKNWEDPALNRYKKNPLGDIYNIEIEPVNDWVKKARSKGYEIPDIEICRFTWFSLIHNEQEIILAPEKLTGHFYGRHLICAFNTDFYKYRIRHKGT